VRQSEQHEAVHPHEKHIKRHNFSDGTTWMTCNAVIDGKRCRYATGAGRDPKIICRTHTGGDFDDVLPQLEGIVVPENDPEFDGDQPEPIAELSMDGWTEAGEAATQPEVFEPKEGDTYIEDEQPDDTEDEDAEDEDAEEVELGDE
jgi:hypothetical protein